MQFGYFDDAQKEYVITRPDTPRSWTNYMGNTRYGGVITNNGGGYSFYRSAGQGRIHRFRFNAIPMDQPGRYIYIHDKDSKDFWSATWQPVGKPLDEFKSVCRFGTGYTIITSEYRKIQSETIYFIPLDRNFECWRLKLTNLDDKKRQFSLFTYLEYVGNWNALDDMLNIQYTQYTVKMDVIDNIIDHGTNVHIPPMPDNFEEKDQGRHTFLGIIGADVKGYDTDREIFLGPYRSYANPVVVEQGHCTNSLASGDNACGTLQIDISLLPGECQEIIIVAGVGEAKTQGKKVVQEFQDLAKVHAEFDNLKAYWHSRMEGMTVNTPDSEFNSMMNMWNPYNCLITYSWARAASLIYTASERDGLGYRDAVQDILGILHTIPQEARDRLELMITGQVSTGGAMPVVKPYSHHPGQEKAPAEEDYRSDDCLWLFVAVPAYVKETGDIEFYHKVLPYADEGKDTVLAHLRRAIEFNLKRSGVHGLPCGLHADWNDCLRLGHRGESVFVAFQLRYALKAYIEICERLNRQDEIDWAMPMLTDLDDNLATHAWDGDWFLRAYRYDGFKFGSKQSDEGSIFLNPQSWAIISGHAESEQAEKVLQAVRQYLFTDFGLMICDTPFEKTDHTVVLAKLMNKGCKENGGIFCHTQGWAVMAETMLGNGDRAYQYFRASMPAAYNTRAEIREIEPYVYCQSTHSKYSPRYGASRIPWLSGSASWAYYASTQYILGIRPEYDGLRIDPCIPANWRTIGVTRIFRGKKLNIYIENLSGLQKQVRELIVNGKQINGNLIQHNKMKAENTIHVIMG